MNVYCNQEIISKSESGPDPDKREWANVRAGPGGPGSLISPCQWITGRGAAARVGDSDPARRCQPWLSPS